MEFEYAEHCRRHAKCIFASFSKYLRSRVFTVGFLASIFVSFFNHFSAKWWKWNKNETKMKPKMARKWLLWTTLLPFIIYISAFHKLILQLVHVPWQWHKVVCHISTVVHLFWNILVVNLLSLPLLRIIPVKYYLSDRRFFQWRSFTAWRVWGQDPGHKSSKKSRVKQTSVS